MLKNYLKIAFRNLIKHRVFAVINIFGLAIGIGSAILAFLFVRDEFSYDRFHENSDRIFKITLLQQLAGEGSEQLIGLSPIPLGPEMVSNYPEIERAVRFRGTWGVVKTSAGLFRERFQFADPEILGVFTFPLLKGDAASALSSPSSLVISESMASKYFDDGEALGKQMQIKISSDFEDFVVTGIAQNVPKNSSIHFDFLLPFEIVNAPDWALTSYSTNTVSTYLLVGDKNDPPLLSRKATTFLTERWQSHDENMQPPSVKLQPLQDIHFDSGVTFSAENVSSPTYSYVLASIALAILIIACINFITLTIGRSSSRSKEIGLRKVMGARRDQLFKQFWGEALLLSAIALVLGVALAEAFLPRFNLLSLKNLELSLFANPANFIALTMIALFVAIVAGSYPALAMSRFHPATILKRKLKLGSNNFLTRFLVVVQFSLSVCLIIGTLITAKQLEYLQKRNLGFDKEAVVVIPIFGEKSQRLLELVKQDMQTYQSILGVSGTSFSFARGGATGLKEIASNRKNIQSFDFRIDYDFLNVMGIQLSEGRNFSEAFSTDPTDALIVNEAFVKAFGWQHGLGQRFEFRGGEKTVIGVAKDFHFKSLHQQITPMIMHVRAGWPILHILVRISPENGAATLALLRERWRAVSPDDPFLYSFLDDDLNLQYQTEEQLNEIVRYSSVFALLVACLGLFGLVTIVMVNRTKEIGVRKVLGASTTRILSLVSWDFAKLLLLANVLAWPIAFFLMNRWLQDFAYRIDIGWWVFALAGGLALVIALLTVSTQAVRAALANPVEALRCE